MKIAMFARADDRGLGVMTKEWHDHVQPDRVAIIHPRHRLVQHDERYPADALKIDWRSDTDQSFENADEVRQWLDGADVLYSAETMYDWNVPAWCRERNVASICHIMPEYYRHGRRGYPGTPADVWWNPTPWRHDMLPEGARIVPVPVMTEHWPSPDLTLHDPVRWLHVGGAAAALDRNGTQAMLKSLRYLKRRHHVTVRTQDQPEVFGSPIVPDNVELVFDPVAKAHYSELYVDADALVLPRRYGGLSLPAQEAMGAGLGLVMSDVEPQSGFWPIKGIPPQTAVSMKAMCGDLPIYTIDPAVIGATLDHLAVHPSELADSRLRARQWAEGHSWARLLPTIVEELERAAELRQATGIR